MFTGIVKAIGAVERMREEGGDLRLGICSPDLPWRDYAEGDSIAVNGVCLTAVRLHDAGFETDVSPETVNVTALRQLTPGSRVNLEPAMRVGDRLGGHLVSGHVDCVGTVIERREDARSIHLRIALPASYGRYVVKKGSICVDGVSLTINDVSDVASDNALAQADARSFAVNIIPHTASATIAGGYAPGTRVNIEIDQIARYLEGLLQSRSDPGLPDGSGAGADLSRDFPRAHGNA